MLFRALMYWLQSLGMSICPNRQRQNPPLRAGAATDREGYFEIRSANIKPEDVIIFKFIRFRDLVYTIGDFMETYKGEEN